MQACTVEVAEPGLTEEQLMEVFKQTSIFNVRSAMAGNEALLGPEVDATEDDRRAECSCSCSCKCSSDRCSSVAACTCCDEAIRRAVEHAGLLAEYLIGHWCWACSGLVDW